MTKLLVSLCNLFPPAPALGLYDGAADSFRWLDLSGVREQIAGATGGCFAHGHCWTILPLPDARCLLLKLDHRFELRQVFYLQDVRDAHSLIPYEDGFLVSDTSHNAITRLDLHGSSVSETVLWRADDRREHCPSGCLDGASIIVGRA